MKKGKIFTSLMSLALVLSLGACSASEDEDIEEDSSSSCQVCEESCENESQVGDHEHSYSSTWKYDETGHYHIHACTICGDIKDKEYHEADETGTCITCGYTGLNVSGLTYALNSDGTSYYVSKYDMSLTATDLFIPTTYLGLPVTAVGYEGASSSNQSVFIGNSSSNTMNYLRFVKIPSSVTTINPYAFRECYSLTDVVIPDSVTSIGGSAFFDCYSLDSIYLPNSITSIGDSAFQNCYSLKNITLPDALRTIETYLLWQCYSLAYIVIPKSVTSVGDSAFRLCYSLSDVYYCGLPSDWSIISISSTNNSWLETGYIHYYNEDGSLAALDSANSYWHYNEEGEITLW